MRQELPEPSIFVFFCQIKNKNKKNMARKKHSLNDATPVFSRKRRLVYVWQASERSVLVKMEKEEFRAGINFFYSM